MKKNIIEKVRESDLFLTAEGRIISPKEAHAFGIGIYHGITPTRGIPKDVMKGNEDVRREPHYAKFGFVVGRVGAGATGMAVGGAVL